MRNDACSVFNPPMVARRSGRRFSTSPTQARPNWPRRAWAGADRTGRPQFDRDRSGRAPNASGRTRRRTAHHTPSAAPSRRALRAHGRSGARRPLSLAHPDGITWAADRGAAINALSPRRTPITAEAVSGPAVEACTSRSKARSTSRGAGRRGTARNDVARRPRASRDRLRPHRTDLRRPRRATRPHHRRRALPARRRPDTRDRRLLTGPATRSTPRMGTATPASTILGRPPQNRPGSAEAL